MPVGTTIQTIMKFNTVRYSLDNLIIINKSHLHLLLMYGEVAGFNIEQPDTTEA
mgnify:CR=1 FL=1